MIAALLVIAPILQILSGESDLTPPEPLPLGGYTERMGKIFIPGGDTLKARALVFVQGSQRVAFIQAEMLTIPESLYHEVLKKMPKGEKLVLTATHTHCAPDSQMLNDRMTFAIPGIAAYRKRWLDWYAGRIAQAVTKAKPFCAPTRIWKEERWLDANRTRRPGGQPDQFSTTVVAQQSHGFPLFFHYAAHPVIYDASEQHLRSDWPGLVKDRGLTLLGAIGDVSPKAEGQTAETRMEGFRNRLLKRVPYLESTIAEGKQSQLRYLQVPIQLGKIKAHPEFAARNRIGENLAQTIVEKFAPTEAEITAVRIGKLAIVGIPGEPTAELGRKLKEAGKRMGFTVVLVVSHANGWIGYILSADDYSRGGYEATLSFHGPEQGEKVVEAGVEALRQLAARK